jgi:hypothetical protein
MNDWLFIVTALAVGLTMSNALNAVCGAVVRGLLMRLTYRVAGRTAADSAKIQATIKTMMGIKS